MAEIVTRDRLSELTVLSRLAERAGEAETAEALLEGALDDVLSLSDDDVALALLVDDDEHVLRLAAQRHVPAAVAIALATHAPRLDQGVLGEAVASGRLTMVDRHADDVRVVGPELFGLGVDRLLVLPLRAAGRSVGLILLGGFGTAAVPGERLPFLEVVGGQLGAFVDAVRQCGVRRASVAAFERLTAVAGQMVRLQDAGQLLSLIVEEAGRMLNADAVGIRKVEGAELVLIAQMNGGRGLAFRPRIKIGESLTGRIARDGQPVAVYDIAVDDRPLRDHAERALAAGFRSFLGVPFISNGQVTGTLSIYTREPRRFSETEVRLLSAFAEQAAVAIENAKLYAAQDLRAARLRTLAEVNRVISSSLDPGVVLPAIGNAARDLMGARVVTFWRADEQRRTLTQVAFSGEETTGARYPAEILRFGESGAGRVAADRTPLHVPDVLADDSIVAHDWWRMHGVRSLLCVPILLDEELLGVLAMCGERPFVLDADTQELLQGFVIQAAVALRNARLFAASEKRRRVAEALADISRTQVDSPDHEAVARRIVESVAALLGTRMALLYRLEPESGDLVYLAGTGQPRDVNVRLPKGVGVVDRAVQQRQPVYAADLLAEPNIVFTPEIRARLEQSSCRAVLAVPLVVHGQVIGALAARDEQGRVFDEEDARILQALAGQAAVALENARLYQESESQRRSLAMLVKVTQRLTSGLELPAVLRSIGEAAALLFQGEAGFRLLQDGQLVRMGVTTGARSVMINERTPLGESISGRVATTGEPIVTADRSCDERLAPEQRRAADEDPRLAALMCVPIRLGSRILGTLNVYRERGHVFDAGAVRTATTFADQAAIAIENARLFTESERRRQAAEEIAEIGRILSGSLDPEVVAERIVDSISRVLQVELPTLYRHHPASGELTVAAGAGGGTKQRVAFPSGVGVVGRAVADREPFTSADVLTDPRLEVTPEFRAHVEKHGRRAALAVPLITGGEVIGVLLVRDRAGRVFSEEEIGLARAFAAQAAVALKNAEMLHESRTRQARLETLLEVNRQLTVIQPLEVVLRGIAAHCGRLLDSESASFRLVEGDDLVLSATWGDPLEVMLKPRLKVGESLSGIVAATGQPLHVADAGQDPRCLPEHREASRALGHRGWLGVPLRVGEKVVGVLSVRTCRADGFSDTDAQVATAFAAQAAVAVENARLYRRAEERAERLAALSSVTSLMLSAGESREVYAAVARAATTLLGGRLTRVWICDAEADVLRLAETYATDPAYTSPGLEMTTTPMRRGVLGSVMESLEPQYIPEILDDPRFINRRLATAGDFHSVAAIPFVTGGRGLGALMTFFGERREFSDEDKGLMRLLAGQAAIAIEKSQLYEALSLKNEHLQELFDIARQATMSLRPSDLVPALVKAAAGLVGQDAASIRLLDRTGTILQAVADHGLSERFSRRGDIRVSEGAAGIVVAEGQPLVVEDVSKDPRYLHGEAALAEGIRSLAIVPMRSRERVIGTLCTYSRSSRRYSAADIELLARFADVAAVAIENARLYEDAQTRAARMKRLGELSHLVNSSLDLQEVLDFVADAARELLRGDIARLCVADANDPDLLRLTAESGGGEVVDVAQNREFRRGVGVAGWMLEHKRSYYSPDLLEDPLFTNKAWARTGGYVSMLMVPLLLGDRSIGTLGVMTQVARVFSDDERELLELFAAKAAIAISNARLYAKAMTHAERMTRLTEVSQLLSSSLDTQRVLNSVTEAARDLVKADLARLWVLDEEHDVIRLAAQTDDETRPLLRRAVPRGEGAVGWVDANRRTYYAANVLDDPIWINKEWARTAGYVSALIVPLVVGDRAIGNLTIMSKTMRAFSADERELLELFAAKAATTLENARLYADLRAQTTALQAKNAELDSFVYVVSHDLRSPLVAIQGMASMIEADHADRLDERGQRYLKRIVANVDQMERLIGDLLALSRIGREARSAEPITVNEVVDEVLLELAERIRSRGVKVSCAALGSVVAVRTQMVQIWTNLVSNAVKYLGDTPAPAVEIGGADRGDVMEYWVRDNGVGIDPAYHAQVFEVFQRLKEVEAEGTGVGLAIVKKIIEAAGGRVWLESAKGQGATFYFTWPKARTA